MGRRPGAHAARPGPGRHPVQPAGVGRHVHRAQAAGHAGLAGLAVVGPQRPDPQPGELDMRHPAQSLQGRQALAWFDYYVRDRGTAPPQNFQLLPRLGLPGHARHHRRPTRRRRPTRSAGADVLPVRHQHRRHGRRAGDQPHAGVAGHERVQQRWRRSARTTPRRRALDQSRPVTDPPGHGDPVRHAAAGPADGRRRLAAADRAAVRPVGGRSRRRPAGRPAGGLRQALRRRPGRRDRAAAPADLAGPRRRRHQAGDHRAAGDRAPLRGRAPARGGPGRRRHGLPRARRRRSRSRSPPAAGTSSS